MTSKRNIRKHLATSHLSFTGSKPCGLTAAVLRCAIARCLSTVWQEPCVEEVDNPVIFRFYLGIVLWTALWTSDFVSG